MLELDDLRKHAYRDFLTAHARLNEAINFEMEKANLLPLNWYDVLVTLEYAPDHALRMSELAERVLLSRSGLTRLVDKLESKGWIVRKGCPKDKRGTHAVLTEAGQQAREASWPLYSSLVEELFGSQMSDDDVRTLSTVMTRVTDAIVKFKSLQ